MDTGAVSAELQALIDQADAGKITITGRLPYSNSPDLSGQVFGELVVLQRLPNTTDGTRWLCKCSCGQMLAVRGGNLKSGGSTSCGCVRRRTGEQSSSWKGCGELTGRHWAIIKASAKKRGHLCEMEIEEAWALFQSQEGRCALTGWQLSLSAASAEGVTASLDRIDSGQGYTIGNTQWVHKDLNLAKNVFSQDYFIEICQAVAAHREPR